MSGIWPVLTIKKHLSLKPLTEGFKKAIDFYADKRRQNSTDYTIQDTVFANADLSGSVFDNSKCLTKSTIIIIFIWVYQSNNFSVL